MISQSRWPAVDHREIFRGHEQLLPTFNSFAIESMLWRIDGLADRFLYFNDDMVLVGTVESTFSNEGKVKSARPLEQLGRKARGGD